MIMAWERYTGLVEYENERKCRDHMQEMDVKVEDVEDCSTAPCRAGCPFFEKVRA